MEFLSGEINIICSNLAESRKFYENILGFTFIENDSGAVRLSLGKNYYLLLPVATKKRNVLPYCTQTEISFDLKVKDIKSAYEYLKSCKANIAQEIENGSWFVIADPDGNHLEILQE